jgi:Fe-S oxidoreductase
VEWVVEVAITFCCGAGGVDYWNLELERAEGVIEKEKEERKARTI